MANKQVSPETIRDMAISFFESKTLSLTIELGLCSNLSNKTMTAEEISQVLNITLPSTQMLLTACTAVNLLEKKGNVYSNSELAEKYLVRGKPDFMGDWVLLWGGFYSEWGNLKDGILKNEPINFKSAAEFFNKDVFSSDEFRTNFMFNVFYADSLVFGPKIAESFDFSPFKKLLDVGGGHGGYTVEIVSCFPQLNGVVFDIEPVCEIGRRHISQSKVSERVEILGGDFFQQPFPSDIDVILFSRIMGDWEIEKVRVLIKKSYAALPSGGAIIIHEDMLNDEKTGPPWAAYLSLSLFLSHGGSMRSPNDYRVMLDEAGFTRYDVKKISALTTMVTASKP